MLTVGTAHFISRAAAKRKYWDSVDEKLAEGAIFIGRPPIGPDQRLVVDSDGRYHIADKKKD